MKPIKTNFTFHLTSQESVRKKTRNQTVEGAIRDGKKSANWFKPSPRRTRIPEYVTEQWRWNPSSVDGGAKKCSQRYVTIAPANTGFQLLSVAPVRAGKPHCHYGRRRLGLIYSYWLFALSYSPCSLRNSAHVTSAAACSISRRRMRPFLAHRRRR